MEWMGWTGGSLVGDKEEEEEVDGDPFNRGNWI